MTVTKQQQLELIAKECHTWKGRDFILVSDTELGYRLPVTAGCHLITREEWQRERDKMSSKPEVDNSWHERGELPQVGTICEVLNSELYNPAWEKCTIIFMGEYKCIYSSETRSEIVGNVGSTGAIEFRPLRTELEKAIDEMVYEFINHYGDPKGGERYLPIAAKLYDAGYRKVKP